MTKLYFSHSAINTYKECPRKYKLHYIDRIRPVWAPSYFVFGSALDSAVEYMLLNFEDYDKEKYFQEFVDALTNYEINKELVDTSKSTKVRYSAADCQYELLSGDTINEITDRGNKVFEGFTIKTFIDHYKALKKQQRLDKKTDNKTKPIDNDIQMLYNYICYNCLIEKGRMILATFETWALDEIKEVHNVQTKIEIENNNGDVFTGYLDFEVTLKNGERIIFDFKSSSNISIAYPADSADKSFQLGVYSQEMDNPKVAYIAFDKNIRKKEPRLRWKVVKGTITDKHLDTVFSEITEHTTALKEDKEFNKAPKETKACFNFGGCKYYNYCHNKENMTGLVNLGERDEPKKS